MLRVLPLPLILLTGCQGVVGPLQRRENPPATIGAPYLPTDVQDARIRQNLPFSSGDAAVGPPTYFNNPLSRGSR